MTVDEQDGKIVILAREFGIEKLAFDGKSTEVSMKDFSRRHESFA